MKLLTSLTVLLAIPAIITGLWGVNVPVPFEGQSWGFLAVLGITVMSVIITAIFMIRKNMFH